ncbi:MAG: ferredoxin [candidate division Zixibacteria bacterium]|nr:ferredoxin [candidate division KSB1 bacterium]NIR64994.1 ferredoxin [candidate division Zixibacteria bacterium]NIW45787.1 ferredoxin [Gammaproteobacteria bacterium]NIS46787.1 ferredoxin [candidate division Zixibacteria bacterium]NIT72109.1 ferredoxin [candidate division KSB1 bacterium]
MPKPTPVIFDIDWNSCIKCGACIAVCPKEAGFTSPFDTIPVDRPCDIACIACEEICPVSAIAHEEATGITTPVQFDQ